MPAIRIRYGMFARKDGSSVLGQACFFSFQQVTMPFLDYPEEIVLAKPRKKRKNLELYAGIGRA